MMHINLLFKAQVLKMFPTLPEVHLDFFINLLTAISSLNSVQKTLDMP